MGKFGSLAVVAWSLVLAGSVPAMAGCICKDTRGSWCAKNCYACFANRAVPAGYCSYWLDRRKHRAKAAPS